MSEPSLEPEAFASPDEPTLMRPVQEGDRIASLDVLRGVAILGIFFVNMQLFAMPFMSMMGTDLPGKPTSEHMAWGFMKIFCEFKFISMFSLLFGAGLVMQMMRAERASRSFVPFFLRRLVVLALFGMVHFTFFWAGDILFVYACFGVILMFLRRVTARMFLILAAVFLSVALLLGLGFGALNAVGTMMQEQQATAIEPASDAPPGEEEATPAEGATDSETEPAELSEPPRESTGSAALDAMLAAQFQPFSEVWAEAETIAHKEGPFREALIFRLVTYGFAFIAAFFQYGWHVLAMFCIGAALMKLDFFRPEHITAQKKLMIAGWLIGLPLQIASAAINVIGGHELNFWMALAGPVHQIGAVALCLGYVGTICYIASRGWCRPVLFMFTRVGRMALSAYLLETLVASFIMYWWGLGMFGDFTRVEQTGLTVAIYAGIMLFCTVWLMMFRMGPFEWLWRSLSYARPQPILRQ